MIDSFIQGKVRQRGSRFVSERPAMVKMTMMEEIRASLLRGCCGRCRLPSRLEDLNVSYD